ncbi:MAG: ParB/RepB/Spo0J family partition protein [Gemmatimonadales bacterium]
MTDKQKRRLGRGLEALLGPVPTVEDARAEGALLEIPLANVRPNPYQPRREFAKDALADLANSLKQSGLLQPIVVRRDGAGAYELIAGERRTRAAQSLGWKSIGAVVREVDNRTLLTLALVENLQRDQLSAIDEALGYQRLIEEFKLSQGDVAEVVGKSRPAVANAIRLLRLPQAVQDLVHRGELAMGHARALLQQAEPKVMRQMAEQAVREGLSVREMEALARGDRVPASRPRAPRVARKPSPEVRRVEDALRRRLKTDVFVAPRGKGGRITVNYYSNEDLARLLELVLGEPFDG